MLGTGSEARGDRWRELNERKVKARWHLPVKVLHPPPDSVHLFGPLENPWESSDSLITVGRGMEEVL